MSDAGTVEKTGRRSYSEVQDAFATMLVGNEEQPEKMDSQEEQPDPDSFVEEQEMEAEFTDDSVTDEQDDDALDDEQLSDGTQMYTVTIDGTPEEVPLDELIAGYSRTAAFTKKSQDLAEQRDAFQSEQEALRQTYHKYNEVLSHLQQQMEAATQPANFDWDALEREDPIQWLKLKELERQRASEIQAVAQERQKMQQLMEQERAQRLQEHLAVEQRLMLEKIPEWADSDVQAEEQRKLVEFGKSVGFSDDDLNTLYDHRQLVVLRDAMRYNELTKGEKVAEAKSKIGSARGGSKKTVRQTRSRKQKAQRQKLRQSGKVEDAAALMGQLLAD